MLAWGAVAILVTGCAAAATASGSPMMGGGMGMGYRASTLTCVPPVLPGSTVRVVVGDMGMSHMASGPAPLGAHMMLRATPISVPAGEVSMVVFNMGWRTHELVVLPLADDATAGHRAVGADGTVDESGSLGEASSSCAEGSGDGIVATSVGWISLTLPAGHYELLCNLPNHYAGGMYQELVVT